MYFSASSIVFIRRNRVDKDRDSPRSKKIEKIVDGIDSVFEQRSFESRDFVAAQLLEFT